jgi:hypothetical protein
MLTLTVCRKSLLKKRFNVFKFLWVKVDPGVVKCYDDGRWPCWTIVGCLGTCPAQLLSNFSLKDVPGQVGGET